MPSIYSTPSVDTHLETQAVLYPTLQYLVQLLPLDHRRVKHQLQETAQDNPFLIDRSTSLNLGKRGTLLNDVLPEWYTQPSPELNLQEHLAGQISALSLPLRQREALIYLTQWLSPSGYLEETPETWARGSLWSARELELVVSHLQSLDPPGIGARSLQECLLLQLPPQTLPTLLVQDYLEDLAACIEHSLEAKQNRERLLEKLQDSLYKTPKNRHLTSLALDLPTLEAAIRQIQSLEPRPGRNFSYTPAMIAIPDLIAEPQTGGWRVSLAYEVERDFCLNEDAMPAAGFAYALLAQSKSDAQRLATLLHKAQTLLTALNQWQENLLKVGEFLVARQQAFLSSQNNLDLVPTQNQMVAQSVGLSNATISRIVRERYLLIRGQSSQIVPLRSLCTPLGVGGRTPQQLQQSIEQLIQEESITEPLTDEELAQLLKLRFGLAIARRTVTKYRQQLGLEPSHKRRRSNHLSNFT